VKTFPYYCLETQPELGKIPLKQEICQLFTLWDPSSKINPWTETDLLRKAKELGNTLKRCSCMGTKNIVESGESTESECPSKRSEKAFQSWDCVCEGDCCCAQSFVLDVEGFLKERNQFLGEELLFDIYVVYIAIFKVFSESSTVDGIITSLD